MPRFRPHSFPLFSAFILLSSVCGVVPLSAAPMAVNLAVEGGHVLSIAEDEPDPSVGTPGADVPERRGEDGGDVSEDETDRSRRGTAPRHRVPQWQPPGCPMNDRPLELLV